MADGDDLISYNFFDACFRAAQAGGDKCIVIPQYLLAFGTAAHLWKYHGSDCVSPLVLVGENAFLSRVFVLRTLYDDLSYADATGGRRAYEDWHFNATALARGYAFVSATDAVLYYRQRPGSIMATTGDRLIPPTEFFQPALFLELCGTDYADTRRLLGPKEPWEGLRTQLRQSSVLLELTRAANRIDPAIDFGLLDHVVAGSNVNGNPNLGAAYYEVCLAVGAGSYTDVLLVPNLNAGGAEKYILSVLDVLAANKTDFRLLVLSGEPADRHQWVDRLPAPSDFVDLHEIACRWGASAGITTLALRIIQSVAPEARVHLKPSGFTNAFVSDYASELPGCELAYYYFCEDVHTCRGVRFSTGGNFTFLGENAQHLHYLISDHRGLLNLAQGKLPLPKVGLRVLYAAVPQCRAKPTHHTRKSVLWASRLHEQKRPALLPLIARKLQAIDPAWQIDVFGGGPSEPWLRNAIEGLSGISLRGPYSSFDGLPRTYAAFLYTAAYDGLPNVILEAMAAGLPVLAPRLGGIGEVLSDNAGILVEDLVDDHAMATLYVEALVRLDQGLDRNSIISNAAHRLRERHMPEQFSRSVLDLFGAAVP